MKDFRCLVGLKYPPKRVAAGVRDMMDQVATGSPLPLYLVSYSSGNPRSWPYSWAQTPAAASMGWMV